MCPSAASGSSAARAARVRPSATARMVSVRMLCVPRGVVPSGDDSGACLTAPPTEGKRPLPNIHRFNEPVLFSLARQRGANSWTRLSLEKTEGPAVTRTAGPRFFCFSRLLNIQRQQEGLVVLALGVLA